MKGRMIREGLFWVGAIDWHRRLFDSLIPLPDGTSYNAYLIVGKEKTALVDAVDPSMVEVLFSHLDGVQKIDFIIVQHAEQDHSGTLPAVLEKYPHAKVLATPKGKELLSTHLLIPEEKVAAVEDGEALSLGGKTLKFIHTPWVHWPDTMVTCLVEDNILLTCDLFGSHLATANLYAGPEEARVLEAAKRYYAEIMMPLHIMVKKNLEKLAGYKPALIAPSHGPIYDQPERIVKAYHEWVVGDLENKVVLPFVSMHDSTRRMVDYLVAALLERNIGVEPFDLPTTDIGKLATALVDAATLVLGTPTVLGGPHPSIASAAYLINALKPRIKYLSIIGSYGWGGKAIEELTGLVAGLKAELLPPVYCMGIPRQEDLALLDDLVGAIAEKHKTLRE
jgi:flavorubredoxin